MTKGFKRIDKILVSFESDKDKYLSREWQAYGVNLSKELNDDKHKSLYIKMARDYPRPLLEQARSYVKDAKVDNKGRLFMWKVKQLKTEKDKVNTTKTSNQK